jgi:hypothetical protein
VLEVLWFSTRALSVFFAAFPIKNDTVAGILLLAIATVGATK